MTSTLTLLACEDHILTLEKATSTLNIIADACGNGEYTDTQNVEQALTLVTDAVALSTKQLRRIMWPREPAVEERSALYLAYRERFDAWRAACDADAGDISSTGGALQEAIDELLKRPIRTWDELAEAGIVAHDYAWNRCTQRYVAKDCPDNIFRALILGILELGGRDAVLHQPPPGWKSPLSLSN